MSNTIHVMLVKPLHVELKDSNWIENQRGGFNKLILSRVQSAKALLKQIFHAVIHHDRLWFLECLIWLDFFDCVIECTATQLGKLKELTCFSISESIHWLSPTIALEPPGLAHFFVTALNVPIYTNPLQIYARRKCVGCLVSIALSIHVQSYAFYR